jgi:predicted O-methyltransferase YrrM
VLTLEQSLNGAQMPPPVPGIQFGQLQVEFQALVDEYVRCAPMQSLEIGTWQGGSLWHWLQNAPRGARVISLDKGPQNWRPQVPGFDTARWHNWAPDGVMLHILERDSHDSATLKVVEDITLGRLDFLFIDGDHSYEGAKADFELYGPLVRPGGLIAFHDLITPRAQQHIQIAPLWAEIRRAGYKTRELYSHPGQEWGGIGVVYVE